MYRFSRRSYVREHTFGKCEFTPGIIITEKRNWQARFYTQPVGRIRLAPIQTRLTRSDGDTSHWFRCRNYISLVMTQTRRIGSYTNSCVSSLDTETSLIQIQAHLSFELEVRSTGPKTVMSLCFSYGCILLVQVYRCIGSSRLWMCSPLLERSILPPELDSSSLTADIRSCIHPQTTQCDLCISQVVLVLALVAAACGRALHSLCTAIHGHRCTASHGQLILAVVVYPQTTHCLVVPCISHVVLVLTLALAVCGCSLSATTHARHGLRNFYFHLRQMSVPCWRTLERYTICKPWSCEVFPNPQKHNTLFSWIHKPLCTHINNRYNISLPFDRVTGIYNSVTHQKVVSVFARALPINHFRANVIDCAG